ncbi:MAG: TRAP transporter large permease subunit [Rhizobiaceae bacterium]|nr:TRAP transporter large permease subunit [Rhizobiaceae bacterium]
MEIEAYQTAPAPRLYSPFAVRMLVRAIEAFAAATLTAMVLLVFVAVFFRYFLLTPIFWADEVCSLLFIWLSMLGAVIAIERNEHIRLTLVLRSMPPAIQPFVETLAQVLVVTFLAAMIAPAYEHVTSEWIIRTPSLRISSGYHVSALLAGLLLMLVISLVHLLARCRPRDILLALLTVTVAATLLFYFKDVFVALGKLNILIFLVAFLFGCLAIGVPIAFCFGIATLSFVLFTTPLSGVILVGRMDEGMSSLVLLSIPVFVLLGCILDGTGMGKAIVDFLSSMFGHVRAGMSYVLLGSLYLVSGISGSKVSDMATVAPALFPEMKRRGVKEPEMIGLLSTGAVMADTVPPSIVLIVLGSVAGLSIADLFTSGFVIAFVLLVALAIVARLRTRGEKMDAVRRPTFANISATLKIALPILVLPFLIRVAVGEGIATATEVSTVAVVYALIIGHWLYGGLTVRGIYRMLTETAAMSGAILLIMGTSSAAAWALTHTGFANQLGAFMLDLPGGWISFMAISIMLFVVLGSLLEGLPALVLLAPLMFPIAASLGIHGIQYAMVVVVAMNIGLFLPPVGIGFYIACSIGKVAPEKAMPAMWVYLLALVVALVLIALVPAISIAYL